MKSPLAVSIKKYLRDACTAQAIKYYHFRNQNRPKILLITDSRGFDVTRPYSGRLHPFALYPGLLLKNYHVSMYLNPEKYTTFLDFLRILDSQTENFDFVIAHVGIVDFAPRHKSAVTKIYNSKIIWGKKIFGSSAIREHLKTDLQICYEREVTLNLFSIEMAIDFLIPKLIAIPNLVWIGCNKFILDWIGNYWRPRPDNINLIVKYTSLFCEEIPNTINLLNWTEPEIRKYTYDNVHLTMKGSNYIYSKLLTKIK